MPAPDMEHRMTHPALAFNRDMTSFYACKRAQHDRGFDIWGMAMKRLTMAAMMLCGTICSASADTVWQGDLFITVSNPTCTSNNFPVGAFFRAVFKPANVGDNGTDTKLSLIGSRNAQRYLLANKAFGNGTFSGTGIGTTADLFAWTSVFSAASAAPAPTINTQAVTLQARIATFDDIAGCTLTIRGSLGKRPN